MNPVFLSYAREDRDTASNLARVLEAAGWPVWWDLRLPAGREFDEEIDRRLREASAVVVLWSRASVGSRWVKAEADAAADRGVLIPARLEEVEPPLPYRRTHSADLMKWDGSAGAPGVTQIREAIERLSGAATQPGAETREHLDESKPHGRWRALARAAIVLLTLLVVAFAVWLGRQVSSSGDTVQVPDIIGLRLDEARLELNALGIHGPGERDEKGEPFPEGTPDLETITRVYDVSPPPGSSVPADEPNLTLYLEFCDGRCEPTTKSGIQ